MPKLYNIPSWFSPRYDAAMTATVAAIESRFQKLPEKDEAYLDELRRLGQPWHLDRVEILSRGVPLVWELPGQTMGINAINVRNRFAFQSFLPSYMRASIELFDLRRSPAEDTDMPDLLAERLLSISMGDRWPIEFEGYDAAQMGVVRSVLELLAMREAEPVQRVARQAIEAYWDRFEPAFVLEN